MWRAVRILTAIVGSALAALFLVLIILPQTGLYATYTVLSDSMQPAIGMGSVVVVTAADPASLQPGDIISYTSAQPPFPTITHRIVRTGRDQDGRLSFKTKGDLNLVEDAWDVHYDANRAGLVIASIPLAGYGVAALATTLGRSLLGLLLAGLLAIFWFSAIWAKPAARAIAAEAGRERQPSGSVSPVRVAIFIWLAVGLMSGRPWRAA